MSAVGDSHLFTVNLRIIDLSKAINKPYDRAVLIKLMRIKSVQILVTVDNFVVVLLVLNGEILELLRSQFN